MVTGVWRARANGTRGFVVCRVSVLADDLRCILDEVMSGRGRGGAEERRVESCCLGKMDMVLSAWLMIVLLFQDIILYYINIDRLPSVP